LKGLVTWHQEEGGNRTPRGEKGGGERSAWDSRRGRRGDFAKVQGEGLKIRLPRPSCLRHKEGVLILPLGGGKEKGDNQFLLEGRQARKRTGEGRSAHAKFPLIPLNGNTTKKSPRKKRSNPLSTHGERPHLLGGVQ